MENRTLHMYKSALGDKNLNSIPYRSTDIYVWSRGQQELLNQPKYEQLRIYNDESDQLSARKKMLFRESVLYQHPTAKLESEGLKLVDCVGPDIADEELTLQSLKTDLKTFEEAMLNRGLHFSHEQSGNVKLIDKPIDSGFWAKLKSWLGFIFIWLIGEAYMTFISWKSLRDSNGIEDLFARSLSFAVILFLLHLISRFNKKNKRAIYIVFIGFALSMLLTMLFAPPLLDKIYPDTTSVQNGTNQWSLTGGSENLSTKITNEVPLWVSFYRDFQTLPAILVFIFFVAMQSLLITKRAPKIEETAIPEVKELSEQEEVNNRRKFFKDNIKECESRLAEMRLTQKELLKQNTGSLQDILQKLESNKSQTLEIDKQITAIKTKAEILLADLEARLNEYSIEFKDVLRCDELKSNLVTPEWPIRQDIINYFKIYSI